MDIAEFNRQAWDRQVAEKNKWTIPVTVKNIEAARNGNWSVVLTPNIPVPADWFGDISQKNVLCLASGGGQQGPILAAAGANVTVVDYSQAQLQQDEKVASENGLTLQTHHGLMQDLSAFEDASFDLIFHPVSNCFTPDVLAVWKEAHRVLKPGGRLLAGFVNPVLYLFDPEKEEQDELEVCNSIPFSTLETYPEKVPHYREKGWALEFGHTLEDQIGGQLKAGLKLIDLYEDSYDDRKLGRMIPLFMATLAEKPAVR